MLKNFSLNFLYFLLGVTILLFLSNFVMGYDVNHWIAFGARNCVGLYALSWVCGITFMLSMTISVLQLREVLHPSIFAKIIKPQVSSFNYVVNRI